MDFFHPASSWRGFFKWAAVGILLTAPAGTRAQGFSPESAGARFGLGANTSSQDFHQVEAFADWDLPWQWNLGAKCSLQTRLDLSAGWLGDRGANAAMFTVGPLLVLSHETFPLAAEGGTSPTFLTHTDFWAKDFSEPVQFTSYLGFYWDFAKHWRVGYRYQHMSNAGLGGHNPGLNMHALALSYRF